MFLPNRKDRGFTLLEMSIVVVVVGIMLSTAATVLPTLISSSKIKQSKAVLERFELAIKGYAMTNGQLPCPDTDGDGNENRTTGASSPGNDTCASYVGNIPFRTLQISTGNDPWNRPIKYGVSQDVIQANNTLGANNFCNKILASSLTASDPNRVRTADSAGVANKAYVLVSGGPKNLDGDGDGFFDGANEGTDVDFDDPDRIYSANAYDDQMVAVSFTYLSGQTCSNSSGTGGSTPPPQGLSENLYSNGCSDGQDNDGDNVSDCSDQDCCSDPACDGVGVCPNSNALKITTTSLPVGYVNKLYAANLEASGGTPSYQWTITQSGGATGISIPNPYNSQINGTITACNGSYSVGVKVTDQSSQEATKTLTLTVISDLAVEKSGGSSIGDISITWSLASQKETFTTSGTHLGNIKWSLSDTANFTVDDLGVLKKKSSTQAGDYSLTLSATDLSCNKNIATRNLKIKVEGASVGMAGKIENVNLASYKFSTNAEYAKIIGLDTENFSAGGNGTGSDSSGGTYYDYIVTHHAKAAGGPATIRGLQISTNGAVNDPDISKSYTSHHYPYPLAMTNGSFALMTKASTYAYLLSMETTVDDESFPPAISINYKKYKAIFGSSLYWPVITHMTPNTFVTATGGGKTAGSTGYVRTAGISDDGTISLSSPFTYKSFPTNFTSDTIPLPTDISKAHHPSIIKLEGTDDMYVEAHGTQGRLLTMKIDNNGSFPSTTTDYPYYPFIDSFVFGNNGTNDKPTYLVGEEPQITHVTGDVYAVVYRACNDDPGGLLSSSSSTYSTCSDKSLFTLRTVRISNDGKITSLNEYPIDGNSHEPSIVKVADGIVAIAYAVRYSYDDAVFSYYGANLLTYEISSEGVGDQISYEYFENGYGIEYPCIVHVSGDVYAIVYNGYSDHVGWIRTVKIKQ